MLSFDRFTPFGVITGLAVACCAIPAVRASAAVTDLAFSEVAIERGFFYISGNVLQQFGAGHGFVDLDGDRDLDIVVLGATNGIVGVYENLGSGTFATRSFTSGIGGFGPACGFSAADYDGDGDLDLYLGGWFTTSRLMRNEGNFTFTDVTTDAGLTLSAPSMASTWGDYDGDGWLDLYVSIRTATFSDMTPNQLYRNNGDGTFTEQGVALGVDAGLDPTLVSAFFDMDRDGDSELYLGTDKGTSPTWINRLFENDAGVFTEITAAANAEADVDCMGIAIGDLDFDGFPDLYLTNIAHGNKLLMSNGGTSFVDQTAASGMGSYIFSWATVFADFNNDTHLDTYLCHASAPNSMYHGSGVWPLSEVGLDAGVATANTSYSVSVGDIDEDGDLDLLVDESGAYTKLYVNESVNDHHWSRLRVVGQWPNTYAVGALLEVQTGSLTQIREVHCGSNFKAMNEFVVHVGLADATQADSVSVTWPATGDVRTLTNVPADQEWDIYPPERLGDVNLDGVVNRRDAFEALTRFGSAGTLSAGVPVEPGTEMMDFDGDFDIDASDLNTLLSRVGPVFLQNRAKP
ncbi:MAG: CRTAC1 family protein [Planctomycetota bacterium]